MNRLVDTLENDPTYTLTGAAHGNRVHAEVSAALSGKPRWVPDMWVEIGTRRVIQFGGSSPPGYLAESVQQVDLIYCRAGYRPAVGEVVDITKVEEVFDIKTSMHNEPDQNQRDRLKRIFEKEPNYAWSRRSPTVGGWIDNPKWRKIGAIMGLAGVAATALAFVHSADLYEEFHREVAPLITIYRNTPEGLERVLAAAEVNLAVCAYIGKFIPDDTIMNIVRGGTILRLLNTMPWP